MRRVWDEGECKARVAVSVGVVDGGKTRAATSLTRVSLARHVHVIVLLTRDLHYSDLVLSSTTTCIYPGL